MPKNRNAFFENIENQYKLGSTNEIYMHPSACIDMLVATVKRPTQ
ncbi:MAG: hypothetical protein U0U66_02320 [Cytophagaceae bacterium]